jgi:hypothetical protein
MSVLRQADALAERWSSREWARVTPAARRTSAALLLAWTSLLLLGAGALVYEAARDTAVVGIFATLWISTVEALIARLNGELSRHSDLRS